MTATTWPLTPDGRLLVLRTCDADMKAHGGFQWPTEGHVEAPDWDPDPNRDCGGGLHGLLWGCGNASLLARSGKAARWMVVAVDPADVADIDQPGKIRFRAAEVVLVTADRAEAIAYLVANGATGLPVVYGTATAGDYGTATAGHDGTATAGHDGTATVGDYGTATAGDYGTATAGDYGTATAGHDGTATAGHAGTATAGYAGTATAGYAGTATAGDAGTATAGDDGTATAGYAGTATAGDDGTATAGHRGRLAITWWDHAANRYRITVGYVGEDGIEADCAYRCDDDGRLVKADRS